MGELLVGLAFFVLWLLNVVFGVAMPHAILATAIIFIILGLFIGHPWDRDWGRRVN